MDDAASAVLLSAQRAAARRVDVVANNLANLSTGGFLAQRAVMAERVTATGDASLSMATLAATAADRAPARIEATGRALDLAVEGDGFFLVDTGEGRAFTRAGRFVRGADGALAAPDGARLLDAGGAPVVLPGDGRVAVSADGTLSLDGRAVARIGVWRAPGEAMRLSDTRLAAPVEPDPALGAAVRQGALAGSNVDPVAEIAAMIEAQRRYEALQSLVERDDRRIRNVIETFARAR